MAAHASADNCITENNTADNNAQQQRKQCLPYQQYGVDWISSHFNAGFNPILADVMGLGKTIQTLALIERLKTMGAEPKTFNNSGPILIVSPTSTLSQWKKEITEWFSGYDIQVKIYNGKPLEREQFVAGCQDIIVTNYSLLSQDIDKGPTTFPWLANLFHLVVFDEGHCLKNPSSKMVAHFQKLKTIHKLLLSGTPMQNDVKELLHLIRFLNPSLGQTARIETSVSNLVQAIGQCKQRLARAEQLVDLNFLEPLESHDLYRTVRQLTQFCNTFLLRRTLEDEEVVAQLQSANGSKLSLPNTLDKQYIKYALNEPQKILYDLVNQNLRVASEDDPHSVSSLFSNTIKPKARSQIDDGSNFFKVFHRLRKVVNTPQVVLNDYLAHSNETGLEKLKQFSPLRSAKLDAVVDKIAEHYLQGQSVIVGYAYDDVKKYLAESLRKRKIKFGNICGQTPKANRQKILETFDGDSNNQVLLLAVKAAGEGLNLQKANVVICVDEEFNPAILEQFIGRANRIGQRQQVICYQCQSNEVLGIEQRVLNFSIAKQNLTKLFFANKPEEILVHFIHELLKEYNHEIPGHLQPLFLSRINRMLQVVEMTAPFQSHCLSQAPSIQMNSLMQAKPILINPLYINKLKNIEQAKKCMPGLTEQMYHLLLSRSFFEQSLDGYPKYRRLIEDGIAQIPRLQKPNYQATLNMLIGFHKLLSQEKSEFDLSSQSQYTPMQMQEREPLLSVSSSSVKRRLVAGEENPSKKHCRPTGR